MYRTGISKCEEKTLLFYYFFFRRAGVVFWACFYYFSTLVRFVLSDYKVPAKKNFMPYLNTISHIKWCGV